MDIWLKSADGSTVVRPDVLTLREGWGRIAPDDFVKGWHLDAVSHGMVYPLAFFVEEEAARDELAVLTRMIDRFITGEVRPFVVPVSNADVDARCRAAKEHGGA